MASPITTTGTTLERQVAEVIQAANSLEQSLSEELNQGRFTVTADPETGEVTFSATLICSVSSTGGIISFTPNVYLP